MYGVCGKHTVCLFTICDEKDNLHTVMVQVRKTAHAWSYGVTYIVTAQVCF